MTFRSQKYALVCSVMLLAVFGSSTGQLYENEECRLSNGDFGKCKLQHNCTALRDIISNRIQPVICSFNKSQPIVCCPENNPPLAGSSSNLPVEALTTSTRLPLAIGTTCTTDSGSPGTCQSLPDCPEANTVSSGAILNICYIKKTTPIVCCAHRHTSMSPLPSRNQHPSVSGQRPKSERVTTTTTHPPERSSIAMCEHYSQYVFEMVQSPILFIVPLVTNESQCNSEARKNQIALRGIGLAQYNEFPHITRLGYGNESNVEWNCVGSLISENYILTAAACITSPNSGNVQWARIGDLEPSVYSPNTKAIQRVVEWKTPPGSRNRNSLALLRLERFVDFWGYRRPACLYSRPELPSDGYRFATTAGWGMVDWDNAVTSTKLRKQDLVFVNSSQCRRTSRPDRRRRRRRQHQSNNRTSGVADICVTNPSQGGPSDCVGGLGSPLEIVLETPYCMTSILGVNTAGARGCATPAKSALFTRVSDHVAWIESIVWA